MNKLLLLGLIGGGMYWLLRQSSPRQDMQYLDDEAGRDMDEPFRTDALEHDEEERLLDEALAESFPASDSPAVSPHRPGV